MILNLVVLALLIGLMAALNIVSLLPVFVVRFLVRIKLFRSGSLGYEKYEYVNSQNMTSTRSRYFYRNAENFKTTYTGKINLIMIGISVFVCEILAFSIYLLIC
jgi:hypothetical protein